jgi:hypothetical protein
MEKQKAILFINWTGEEFSYPWGGVEYTFKPGIPMYLEEGLAVHFAKHLANREINKLGKLMSDPLVKTFMQKCYGKEFVEAVDEKSMQVKLENLEKKEEVKTPEIPAKVFCEFCDAKGPIKHRDTCPKFGKNIGKVEKPAVKTEDDEEFPGLKL